MNMVESVKYGVDTATSDIHLDLETILENDSKVRSDRLETISISELNTGKLKAWIESYKSKVETRDDVLFSGIYVHSERLGIKYPLVSFSKDSEYHEHVWKHYLDDVVKFFNGKHTTACCLSIDTNPDDMLLSLIGTNPENGTKLFQYDLCCADAYAQFMMSEIKSYIHEVSIGYSVKPIAFSTGGYQIQIDCESFFGDVYEFSRPGTISLTVVGGDKPVAHEISLYKIK